jgi:hypothetical protein
MSAARSSTPASAPLGEDLRPTREAMLRPTREPRAPFVAGPQLPRIAPAPRAAAVRAMAPAAKPLTGRAIVIGAFPRQRASAALIALREAGVGATLLREARPGPAGLARELGEALRRATIAATCAGGIGALIGALIVPSEALVPGFGWIPGPAVGAAILAGILGAVGFALGMLALLIMPARALKPLVEGDRALIAVTANDSAAAIAAIATQSGIVVAHE